MSEKVTSTNVTKGLTLKAILNEDVTASKKNIYSKTVNDSPVDNARIEASKRLIFKIFIIISTAFAIMEPFLVSYEPKGVVLNLQIAVLTISTALFFIGIHIVTTFMEGTEEVPLDSYIERVTECFDGEVFLELFFLIIGWGALFVSPGVAALRCFRVFRYNLFSSFALFYFV